MIKDEPAREFVPVLRPTRSHSFAGLLDGITLTVAAILIVVIFMAYMTHITVDSGAGWRELGLNSALMYICTVSFYLLLRSFSNRKGKLTENYKKARERVEMNNNKIVQSGYARRTKEYCRAWEDAELDGAREHVLADAGIKLEEFNEKYRQYTKKEILAKFPDLSEYQVQTILRAKKVKRLKYDESYLSVYDKHGRRVAPSGGLKARGVKRIQTATTFFTTALSSLFSVYIAFEIIADPSFATVVTCLIKIVIILGFGAWGMIGGYNLSAVREVEEMGEKADEQERYMKWCDMTPAKEFAELPLPDEIPPEKEIEDAAPMETQEPDTEALQPN